MHLKNKRNKRIGAKSDIVRHRTACEIILSDPNFEEYDCEVHAFLCKLEFSLFCDRQIAVTFIKQFQINEELLN